MSERPNNYEGVTLGENVITQKDTVLEGGVKVGNNVTFYEKVIVRSGTEIFDGAVIGKPPKSAGNMTRRIDSNPRILTIGKGSIIGANSILYTGIRIGNNVLIGDLTSIREDCVFEDGVVIGIGVRVMYNTSVGERTRVIDGAILTGNMTIESDVFIGPGVVTINDNSPYLSRFGLGPHEVKGPTIRRFALIGAGVNINGGIEIGMGSVVAPNAMVIKDVEPWTIVAGIPAVFKKQISSKERDLILNKFGLE